MRRRELIKKAGTLALSAAGLPLLSAAEGLVARPVSKLPRWKGFNVLDFFNPDPTNRRQHTPEEYFRWMADWGFDFVRVPMAYPYYVDFDRTRAIRRDEVCRISVERVHEIVDLVDTANHCGLHVSLNLHRAPGFCVNAGFEEPYNLWEDPEALDAFAFHWAYWAKVFRHKTRSQISFDLLNEPCWREDMNDQFSKRAAVPKERYRSLIIKGFDVIRMANPKHLVIADGNNIGTEVIDNIPELDVAQSCRGYAPGLVSHYRAPWVFQQPDDLPAVSWPHRDNGTLYDKAWLREHFAPWITLAAQGTGVHCGECGAWRETPHRVALAWMDDMFSVLTEHDIGFALWEFDGDFGVLNSNRRDVQYDDWYGHKLDRKLLALLQKFV
ncbi:Aryl-phospho-beta-D-glucosidase BglC, GH1 family [Parapedobacter composti]|uniref:Aryl-phospho-beta-D-glucosidase BglC, GH1 family n=1 Tax=Parapedobacter composti TaxID=623281 RepID=A0A1I1HZB3_9SPHI|nr:cellulase family glycosylhydrolase [Parapedobacter composti]SFC26300.1 Aryl-phospho-beta-D-glucosidase BglC, GH1 family [Parapedobacter composti]